MLTQKQKARRHAVFMRTGTAQAEHFRFVIALSPKSLVQGEKNVIGPLSCVATCRKAPLRWKEDDGVTFGALVIVRQQQRVTISQRRQSQRAGSS